MTDTLRPSATDGNDGNGSNGSAPAPAGRAAGRAELGAFLRNRRERIAPEQAGLPPGGRRRTPGLRREEVAQLAGVGVTWYTWLEQGRPINASVQVLEAVARTLRLDAAERAHVLRLAGVAEASEPTEPAGPSDASHLPPEVQTILDGLGPLPAAVYNSRYDLLAWNQAYATLFPKLVAKTGCTRNVLWHMFVSPACCNQFLNRDTELPRMVATLRGYSGRHLGEPAWVELVDRLSAASPEFARMWAEHDVAEPGTHEKIFRHAAVGILRLAATSLAVSTLVETRVIVYTPRDADTEKALAWLAEHPEAPAADHTH